MNHLRQYFLRFPKKEETFQKHSVSIFLKGLLNKDLHSALYMKHNKYLNLCIHEAIDYNDSYGRSEDDTKSNANNSSIKVTPQINEIVKMVMENFQ